MAVFYDTGGGDIYAGETKEAVLAAMRQDMGEVDADIFEVPGSTKIRVENEDGSVGGFSTLEWEYTDLGFGYCISSENC